MRLQSFAQRTLAQIDSGVESIPRCHASSALLWEIVKAEFGCLVLSICSCRVLLKVRGTQKPEESGDSPVPKFRSFCLSPLLPDGGSRPPFPCFLNFTSVVQSVSSASHLPNSQKLPTSSKSSWSEDECLDLNSKLFLDKWDE